MRHTLPGGARGSRLWGLGEAKDTGSREPVPVAATWARLKEPLGLFRVAVPTSRLPNPEDILDRSGFYNALAQRFAAGGAMRTVNRLLLIRRVGAVNFGNARFLKAPLPTPRDPVHMTLQITVAAFRIKNDSFGRDSADPKGLGLTRSCQNITLLDRPFDCTQTGPIKPPSLDHHSAQRRRPRQDTVLFLSCPEEQKLRFQRRGPLRCAPWSFPPGVGKLNCACTVRQRWPPAVWVVPPSFGLVRPPPRSRGPPTHRVPTAQRCR